MHYDTQVEIETGHDETTQFALDGEPFVDIATDQATYSTASSGRRPDSVKRRGLQIFYRSSAS